MTDRPEAGSKKVHRPGWYPDPDDRQQGFEMIEVRPVSEADLPTFRQLHNQYINRDKPLSTVRAWHAEHPDLLLGAYLDDDLVGHCLGLPMEGTTVELSGIAVLPSYRRQGIGGRLLDGFEQQAAELGFTRVTLGSGGGYVDEFYLANGYTPASILVRVDADETPVADEYRVSDETVVDGTRKLYVDVDGFDPDELSAVQAAFDDPDAIYIMEKALDP